MYNLMIYISEGKESLYLFTPNKVEAALEFHYFPFHIKQTNPGPLKMSSAHFNALLGVKIIDEIPFLMIVAETIPCCTFGPSSIMEVKSIGFLPIVPQQRREQALDKCREKIEDFEKLFEEGHHYYSDCYRLHQSHLHNLLNNEMPQTNFHQQFIFNNSIMRTNDSSDLMKWCTPIIQGYIESFSVLLPDKQRVTSLLISRRSSKKAGTRYFARGIDDTGNVANFTETEQIIQFKQFGISHLQIRGSVPAFFEQLGISGLSGELNISRNEATTQKAFDMHFNKLHKEYGNVFCINLLSLKKSDEKKLTLFFESLINKYAPAYVRYQFFDFHEECKNNKFENADILIKQIKEVIDCFDCTIVNRNTNQVLRRQNGVMRTNCLDCLDRTNYVQSRISLYLFEKLIKNFSPPETREKIDHEQLFENKHEESSELLHNFNSSWADNGDAISLHYTGTGSTHTDITKNGKRTFKGTVHHKLKSLTRFFVQFTDAKKHEAIHDMVSSPMHESRIAFSSKETFQFLNAVIMTFKIPKESEITSNSNYLFAEDYIIRKKPAIVVIFGYLEAEGSVFDWLRFNKKGNKDVQYFKDEKTYTVRRLGYELFSQAEHEGSCLLLFGNQAVVPNLSNIKCETIGKGKDTLLISKFNIFNSSMVFSGMNCSKFSQFLELLQKSHEEAFQVNRLGQAKSSSILSHHYRTVIGNIASGSNLSRQRIQQMKEQIRYLREKKDEKNEMRVINEALDHDHFSQNSRESFKYIKNYMEGPTNFIPGENRIVFWNMQNLIIKVLEYKENPGQRCVHGHFSYELKMNT